MSISLRALQCVIIDNSHPSYSDLYKLGKDVYSANANVFAFPVNDIDELLDNGAINHSQRDELPENKRLLSKQPSIQ